jgi:hypothetical protein
MTDFQLAWEDTFTLYELYERAGCQFPFWVCSWAYYRHAGLSRACVTGWLGVVNTGGYVQQVSLMSEPEQSRGFACYREGIPNQVLALPLMNNRGWLPVDEPTGKDWSL